MRYLLTIAVLLLSGAVLLLTAAGVFRPRRSVRRRAPRPAASAQTCAAWPWMTATWAATLT